MKKNPRFLFWLIIFLTLFAIFIDLPRNFPMNINSPKIPIFNKKISIQKTITNPNLFIGSMHIQKDLSIRKGLDLAGGTSIVLEANMQGVPQDRRGTSLDSAKAVIERRVNFFGVSEPVILNSIVGNSYRIIVELPGITNVNQAISLIGTTAQLTFWEEGASSSAKIASSKDLPIGITSLFPSPQKTNLTGKDLEKSNVTFDQNTGKPQVEMVFTADGAKKFEDITKRNVNKIVAIALDNQIIEAPRVNQVISGGNAVITGSFTTEQAKGLSIQLNAGALPVALSILAQNTVGATLGQTSLQKSLFAGILGFLIIIIFMSVLYGRLGMLSSIALFLYSLFVLALFKFIPITLTLAGMAGFVLSIGMAVDANILIFERMKEEKRRGKPIEIAIELGFYRAWTSIRDSNISSIITSLILIYFGTGIVRGFAITLLIGVLVSMFSAIVVTRTFLRMIYK